MKRLLRKLLRVHSPSMGLLGTCRCRKCVAARQEPRLLVSTLNIHGVEHVLVGIASDSNGQVEMRWEDKAQYIARHTICRICLPFPAHTMNEEHTQ